MFESEEHDKDTVAIIDGTHYVITFDIDMTLCFVGEKQVEYADVIPGGEGKRWWWVTLAPSPSHP